MTSFRRLAEALGWWGYALAWDNGMPVPLLMELRLTRAMIPRIREDCRRLGIDADCIEPTHIEYAHDWVVPGWPKETK